MATLNNFKNAVEDFIRDSSKWIHRSNNTHLSIMFCELGGVDDVSNYSTGALHIQINWSLDDRRGEWEHVNKANYWWAANKDDLVDCSPIVYHYATAHGQSLIFGWWATPQKLVNLKLPPLIVANETQLSSGVIVLWNQWRISIILVENLKRTIEITRSQTVPYGEHFPLCIAFRDFPWLWCFKHKELMQPGI